MYLSVPKTHANAQAVEITEAEVVVLVSKGQVSAVAAAAVEAAAAEGARNHAPGALNVASPTPKSAITQVKPLGKAEPLFFRFFRFWL